jgi:hypothetical protein
MTIEKVYFHIGEPKTGTSVIQSHLQQNRDVLRDRGVFYPVTISPFKHVYRTFESHHIVTYAWAGWEPSTGYSPDRFFARAEATCRAHNMTTLLLSAENTYWLPTQIVSGAWPDTDAYWDAKRAYVERIHQDLKRYDTKIVVYLRRQDHWLETWYNQWIKNGTSLTEDIYPTFAERHRPLLDHGANMKLWADQFGTENVIVRPYEKEQLPDGLLKDFLTLLDLGEPDAYPAKRKPRYNAHLDRDTMEFMNICNSLDLDPQDDWWLRIFLRRVTGQFDRQPLYEEQKLMHPDQRRALLQDYSESNAWVARTLMGRNDGRLFLEPWPDPEAPWTPYPGLSVEHATRLIMSVAMARQSSHAGAIKAQTKKAWENMKTNLSKSLAGRLPANVVARLEQRIWDKYLWGE